MRIETIDLGFRGTPRVIAAFLILGPQAPVLIETGPGSTLPTLLEGLERLGVSPVDVRDVLVTHIHLDHAGAAGWWARQGARVHVHPVGAPHLVDPARLLASSKRIYGEAMDSLWGEVLPAPADRVTARAVQPEVIDPILGQSGTRADERRCDESGGSYETKHRAQSHDVHPRQEFGSGGHVLKEPCRKTTQAPLSGRSS